MISACYLNSLSEFCGQGKVHGQCLCRLRDVMVFGIEKTREAVIKRQTK